MKQRHISLVGSSLVILAACSVLPGCGSDSPAIVGAGGTSPQGGSSGTSKATTGGGSNSSSSSTATSSVGGSGPSSSATPGNGGTSASSPTSSSNATGGTSTSSQPSGSSTGGTATSSSKSSGSSAGGSTASAPGSSIAKGGAAAGGSSATSSTVAAGGGGVTAGGSAAGGASGGNSAAGSSSTAAGAGSDAVTPTKVSDTDYKFDMAACKVVMDVNPKIGGRVSKLTLDGKDVIKPFTATTYDGSGDSNKSGSTFWTSPQKGWPSATWPPVVEIDGGAYTPAINGTHLVATGTANSSLGASVVKDFSADASTCWITQLFTIKATKSITVAPWQITRVLRGGIAIFPQGDTGKYKPEPLTSEITVATGTPPVVWFDDTKKSSAVNGQSGSKLIADGAGGWLAYALAGNLLIIKYPDVKPDSFATDEADVEIYVDEGGYIELEVQGAVATVAKDGTLPWTVQWKVVAIPSSVTVAAKDAGLLKLIQDEVAK